MSFVVLHVSPSIPVPVPLLLLFVLEPPATLYLSGRNPLAAPLFREGPLHTALVRKTGRAGALFVGWKSASAKSADGTATCGDCEFRSASEARAVARADAAEEPSLTLIRHSENVRRERMGVAQRH